ncbi:MAG: autotransporter domain-containing protein [Chthoniobacteraceae bacterium]
MNILKTSIATAISLFSLASMSQAYYADRGAVQEYTGSGNIVLNDGVVGSLTGTTAYGLRFTGTGATISDSNTVINTGIIYSGTGSGYLGNAGIVFNAQDGGQTNSNTVINYGAILPSSSENDFSIGILFNCTDGGDAYYNRVLNYGNITVSGSSYVSAGIAFTSPFATSANYNTVINYGNITVSGIYENIGVLFGGYDTGDSSYNTVVNKGTITVASGTSGYAIGVAFVGTNSGSAVGNTLINEGKIITSGSYSIGVYIVGGSSAASYNTITNLGVIDSGSNGYAIAIDGDNNTINLGGHSSVTGLISGTGNNNVLNLSFTGVNAAERANLVAQLNSIEALSGTATSGTFTFRGVTYTYDPLIVNVTTSSYAEQAKTPNQKAVGANLDSFTVNPTGNMLSLLNALDQSGNVPRGLDQLSPQRYQIYGDIALSNASLLVGQIDQRLNNVRFGSEGFDTSSLCVAYGSVQSKLGMGSNGLPIVAAKESKEIVTQAPDKRWSAFLSGNVGHAGLDDTEDLQNSKYSDSGVIGGVDVKLTDAWTTGLLLGYAHTDASLDTQGSTADVDAYSAGLYGGYHEGNFYGNGLAAYTHNVYDSGRVIDIGTYSEKASGHTTGSQVTVNLDGGYDQPVTKNISAGPFAGVQYVHLGVDGFNESQASAANLNLNDQALDSLRSRLGLRAELKKDLSKNWRVASEVRAAWQHEFANNDRAIVAQFAGSGLSSFAVRTTDPERDRAILGIGLNATCQDTLTVFVDYDAEIGNRYTGQAFKGGLKFNF